MTRATAPDVINVKGKDDLLIRAGRSTGFFTDSEDLLVRPRAIGCGLIICSTGSALRRGSMADDIPLGNGCGVDDPPRQVG